MTKDMTKNITKVKKVKPYKAKEFEKFLSTVGNGEIPETWEKMAEALGITPKTISMWKRLPQYAEARARGIEESWRMMKLSGKRDWKMWRERYAMLTNETQGPSVNVQVVSILGGVTNNVQSNDSDTQDTQTE